jgi:hypothetical protein
MGDAAEAGPEIFFWQLDGCTMDDEFAFSTFRTIEEWSEERRRELFSHEANLMCQAHDQGQSPGEQLGEDPFLDLDELFDFDLAESGRSSLADFSSDPAVADEFGTWIHIEPDLPDA